MTVGNLNDGNEQKMLKPAEVAGLLNISTRTLWRRLSSGDLPRPDVDMGRIKRWWRHTIEEWMLSVGQS